jgi:hypothetical protein
MKISERLAEYIAAHPGLVFQNDGYQEMPRDLADELRPQITEVEALVKPLVWGFVRFQNFKRRENGDLVLRCQVYYDDARTFVGVSYIKVEAFDAVNVPEGADK